jgi:hypothetical protein
MAFFNSIFIFLSHFYNLCTIQNAKHISMGKEGVLKIIKSNYNNMFIQYSIKMYTNIHDIYDIIHSIWSRIIHIFIHETNGIHNMWFFFKHSSVPHPYTFIKSMSEENKSMIQWIFDANTDTLYSWNTFKETELSSHSTLSRDTYTGKWSVDEESIHTLPFLSTDAVFNGKKISIDNFVYKFKYMCKNNETPPSPKLLLTLSSLHSYTNNWSFYYCPANIYSTSDKWYIHATDNACNECTVECNNEDNQISENDWNTWLLHIHWKHVEIEMINVANSLAEDIESETEYRNDIPNEIQHIHTLHAGTGLSETSHKI